MQKLLLVGMLGFFLMTSACSQTSDIDGIKATILSFAKAGDEHNVSELEQLLDENYRVVMNRQFGSKEVSVVPRSVYLSKIKSKEWGGDQRKVSFESIIINGITANVKVLFAGNKMKFVSLLSLVKTDNGNWKLVSDFPIVI